MTDKEQIMINGVDVSECEHLTYPLEEDGQYYWFCNIAPAGGPDECEHKPKCSYKKALRKLTRKTQECEELKTEKEAIKKYLGISDKPIMQRLEELTECKLKRQLKYIKIEEERDRYRNDLKAIEEIVTENYYEDNWVRLTNKMDDIRNIIKKHEEKF